MTKETRKLFKKFNGSATLKKPEKKLSKEDIEYICSGSKLATDITINTLLCDRKSE